MDLHGKVALVTGGASGIGKEIVKSLLDNGVKLVSVLDIDKKNGQIMKEEFAAKYKDCNILFISADVRKEVDFDDAFIETLSKFKKIDIVVNNVGIVNEEEYTITIDVNLTSSIRGTQLALKYLSKSIGGNGGTIINISSVCAFDPLHPGPFYTASKCGIVGYVRSLGHPLHYEESGITVTCLCPHFTTTSLGICGIRPEFMDENAMDIIEKIRQEPDCVGRAAVHVIKNGEPGSVWIISEGNLYKTKIPSWRTFIEIVTENI